MGDPQPASTQGKGKLASTAGIKPGVLVTLVSNPLPDADVLLTVNGTDTEIPWTVAQGVRVDTVVR
jgi:hypothetical protein